MTGRSATNRENPCCVRYRVRKLKSGMGLGWVYPIWIGKNSSLVSFVYKNMLIGSQPQRFWAHTEIGGKYVVNIQLTSISGPLTQIVGSLGLGFAFT